MIGHFRLGSHDVVVERILDLLVVPLGVIQPLARAVWSFMQILGNGLGETLQAGCSCINVTTMILAICCSLWCSSCS